MPNLPPRWFPVVSLLALTFLSVNARSLQAENWPQWRGPDGNGVSHETELPVVWAKTSGIAWQCPLPQWGTSTPAIWGDAVFVTAHVDNQKLVLLRIDKKTGRIEWTRQVGTGQCAPAKADKKPDAQRRHQEFHNVQNLASPSPVTDGEVVVAHFGNGDLAGYDFAGKQLWHRNLQKDYGDYTIWWGHATCSTATW
jgi:hypothetical protein